MLPQEEKVARAITEKQQKNLN